MSVCAYCKREKETAKGCIRMQLEVNCERFERIKVGENSDYYEGEPSGSRCLDCNAQVSYYHHPGCSYETCPLCGISRASCTCERSTNGSI